jgi:hypothetical protein
MNQKFVVVLFVEKAKSILTTTTDRIENNNHNNGYERGFNGLLKRNDCRPPYPSSITGWREQYTRETRD